MDVSGQSQLKELLGAPLWKERGEMEQPFFSAHAGLRHPLAKGAIACAAGPAPHGDRIESEPQILLRLSGFVVNESGTRGIESPPKLRAIARPFRPLARVLARVREQGHDDRGEAVEKSPPGPRIFSVLKIDLKRRWLPHHPQA